jgi:selenium metabolism protein YedF
MSKRTMINASGLACPEPVILTKNALKEYNVVSVTVDNTTAVENIKRLAGSMKCDIKIAEKESGKFELTLTRSDSFIPDAVPDNISCDISKPQATGPDVVVINSETMGRGSDELGSLLMKAFIHTVTELDKKPDIMIFYNAGVIFTTEGSGVLDDLKKLESRGTKILVCGTCLNYYKLTEKISAGIISNMYDIASALSASGRIVQP